MRFQVTTGGTSHFALLTFVRTGLPPRVDGLPARHCGRRLSRTSPRRRFACLHSPQHKGGSPTGCEPSSGALHQCSAAYTHLTNSPASHPACLQASGPAPVLALIRLGIVAPCLFFRRSTPHKRQRGSKAGCKYHASQPWSRFELLASSVVGSLQILLL